MCGEGVWCGVRSCGVCVFVRVCVCVCVCVRVCVRVCVLERGRVKERSLKKEENRLKLLMKFQYLKKYVLTESVCFQRCVSFRNV